MMHQKRSQSSSGHPCHKKVRRVSPQNIQIALVAITPESVLVKIQKRFVYGMA